MPGIPQKKKGVSAARLQNRHSFCVRRAAGTKLGLLQCLPSIRFPEHPKSQGGDTGGAARIAKRAGERGKKPGRIFWSENSSQEGGKCDLHLVTTNTHGLGERRGATITRNAQGSVGIPPTEVPLEFRLGKRQGQVLNMQNPLLLSLLDSKLGRKELGKGWRGLCAAGILREMGRRRNWLQSAKGEAGRG